MPAADTAEPALRAGVAGFQPRQGNTARFSVHWGRSGAVVSVAGELDAANAAQLGEYVQRCATSGEWLVLDLSGLTFIGTAGISVLQTIDARCAQAGMRWALVPGAAASRLLDLCDPTTLPLAESVTRALEKVQKHPLLRVVSQPR